jgi:CBS domain containing-hemolysin-like protein
MGLTYIKMTIIAAAITGCLSCFVYISHLRDKVVELTLNIQLLEDATRQLQAQLEEATMTRESIEAKLRFSERKQGEIANALQVEKKRVKEVVIPTDCPGALDFLVEEVTR